VDRRRVPGVAPRVLAAGVARGSTLTAPTLPLWRRRLRGLGRLPAELLLLRLELLDEVLERGGLDDLVELGAVVGDEAHALDIDVVDEPPGPLLEQPV